jgi:hypothetical protein
MYKLIASKPSATLSYVVVNGKVFKFAFAIQGPEVFTADAQLGKIAENALVAGSVTAPSVGIKITEATEADLCAAQKTNPSKTLELENMIAYMKASNVPQPEPGPLRVEIVNASEMAQKDTVVRVQRDSSGTLTGAIAQKI